MIKMIPPPAPPVISRPFSKSDLGVAAGGIFCAWRVPMTDRSRGPASGELRLRRPMLYPVELRTQRQSDTNAHPAPSTRKFELEHLNALLAHAEEKRVEAYLAHGIPLPEMHPAKREKLQHKIEVAAQMILAGEFADDEITGVRRVMLREAGVL